MSLAFNFQPSRFFSSQKIVWPAIGIAAFVFLQVVSFDFVNWDDDFHIYRNLLVTGPWLFSWDYFLTPMLGYPSPITLLSYKIEYSLFGLEPGVFHFTSLVLHLLNIYLVSKIAEKFSFSRFGIFLVALLFAIHPVVAEPVSWLSGRKDLWVTLFSLLAFLNLQSRRDSVFVLFFCLALLSKPSAAFLLAIFIVFESLFENRKFFEYWKTLLFCTALTIGFGILSWMGQSRLGGVEVFPSFGVWVRDMWYSLGFHLGLLSFIQMPLPKHIPISQPAPFLWMVDLMPLLWGVALFSLRNFLTGERRKIFLFGIAWTFFSYLPNSNLIPLTRYLADSYVYLPLIGISFAMVAVLEEAFQFLKTPRSRRLAGFALGVLFLGLAFETHLAASVYENSLSLWQTVYSRYPDSPQVCRSFANAHVEMRKPEQALLLYDKCIQTFGPQMFLKNKAITLLLVGRKTEALKIFEEAQTLDPSDAVIKNYLRDLHNQE